MDFSERRKDRQLWEREVLIFSAKWWAGRDLNPHGSSPLDPKSSASTSSATRPLGEKEAVADLRATNFY